MRHLVVRWSGDAPGGQVDGGQVAGGQVVRCSTWWTGGQVRHLVVRWMVARKMVVRAARMRQGRGDLGRSWWASTCGRPPAGAATCASPGAQALGGSQEI